MLRRLLRNKRNLDGVIAQLRHAYMQLAAGTVRNQKQFADGLIAPQIRALEQMARGDQQFTERLQMSDLLERLRFHHETSNGDAHATCGEAAIEIERLRAQLKNAVWTDSELCKILEGDNKRLRAALEKIEKRTTDPVARSIAGEAVVIHQQSAPEPETPEAKHQWPGPGEAW